MEALVTIVTFLVLINMLLYWIIVLVRKIHPKKSSKKYECHLCSDRYYSKHNIRQHLRQEKDLSSEAECLSCGVIYSKAKDTIPISNGKLTTKKNVKFTIAIVITFFFIGIAIADYIAYTNEKNAEISSRSTKSEKKEVKSAKFTVINRTSEKQTVFFGEGKGEYSAEIPANSQKSFFCNKKWKYIKIKQIIPWRSYVSSSPRTLRLDLWNGTPKDCYCKTHYVVLTSRRLVAYSWDLENNRFIHYGDEEYVRSLEEKMLDVRRETDEFDKLSIFLVKKTIKN